MPELPEVETVVRGLRDAVLGRTISRVRVSAPPSSIVVGKSLKSRSFARLMTGRRIESVERRGKNILMALSGDLTLWVHLKMTGHFYFYENPVPYDKHDLVTFYLEPLQTEKRPPSLRFNDYRRFGRLRLFSNEELWQQDGLKELGPEPLELDAASFVTMCRTRSRMMKPALLDQSFIAGLGNIYADEALHASRIHPKRLTSSLTKRKLEELHAHIQRLLRMAISKMGTSVDTYAGVDGQPGSFQKYLRAYGREGEACAFCGRKIVREKIGSRSAHYCPRCQRL